MTCTPPLTDKNMRIIYYALLPDSFLSVHTNSTDLSFLSQIDNFFNNDFQNNFIQINSFDLSFYSRVHRVLTELFWKYGFCACYISLKKPYTMID